MYYLYQALPGRIQDGTKTFVSVERSNKKKTTGEKITLYTTLIKMWKISYLTTGRSIVDDCR